VSRLLPRRRVLAGVLPGGALLAGALLPAAPARGQEAPAAATWPLRVTDLLGRSVTVPQAPRRVLLGDGFQFITLSLLHPDPAALLAGWASNLRTLDPALHGAFLRRFPALAAVPEVGGTSSSGISVERALSVAPDLAIFSAWQASSEENRALVVALTRAGVPVVFVDLFLRPLEHVGPSLRLLGQVLGRTAQAEAVAGFRDAHLAQIRQTMAAAPAPGPTVLLHAHAGRWACCWSAGGGGVGEYLALLGGRNIGAQVFPSPVGGALNLEFVIAAAPQVYVATGLPGAAANGGISLGQGVGATEAAQGLAQVLQAPGLATLPAARDGRAHALWSYFSETPLDIVAVELLARWLRPELFGALDPAATLAEINARFAAMPFAGAYWTDAPRP
jgi:iron complex transport system substrate-binding protein